MAALLTGAQHCLTKHRRDLFLKERDVVGDQSALQPLLLQVLQPQRSFQTPMTGLKPKPQVDGPLPLISLLTGTDGTIVSDDAWRSLGEIGLLSQLRAPSLLPGGALFATACLSWTVTSKE